jgi:hypothetical protein
MQRKRKPEILMEEMDDMRIIIHALRNKGFGQLADEIQRLMRLRETARKATEIKRQMKFNEHLKVHGTPHPDDDIPF